MLVQKILYYKHNEHFAQIICNAFLIGKVNTHLKVLDEYRSFNLYDCI